MNARTQDWGRVLLAIPCYNCEPQIGRVVRSLADSGSFVDAVMVIDNRSRDGTLAAAEAALRSLPALNRVLVCNDDNYGLGGSHKVAFEHAIAKGFDAVAILHGDDQGSIADLAALRGTHAAQQHDVLLGARFMAGSRLAGYSRFRTLGNGAFNLLFSLLLGRRIFDLGSGLNLYRVKVLRDRFYWRFPDDLTFNYCMVMAHVALGHAAHFFPISWREEDQVSNVKLFSQARRVLSLLFRFAAGRSAFLGGELRGLPRGQYPCTVIFSASAGSGEGS